MTGSGTGTPAVAETDVTRLRRMIVEPTTATYTDSTLEEYLARHSLTDTDGYEPDDTNWTATYDLNQTASDIWYEKAMQYVGDYQFSADGATFNRQQVYAQCMKAASRFAALAAPASISVRVDRDFERDYQSTYWQTPGGNADHSYIVNAAETDE